MSKLGDWFKSKITQLNDSGSNAETQTRDEVISLRNWYEERYDKLIVQRNILLLLTLVSIVIVVVSIIAVTKIAISKEFDPFAIQIEEQTGSAKIVNPISTEILGGNEALARYFIKRYVTARETYNPVDFDTHARKVIRLLSSSGVFWNYFGYIKNKANDPALVYGVKNTTYLTVKSWSKLDKKKYVLRFAITETAGDTRTMSKIAIVDIDYVPMELSEEERDINPVGFQVTGYRVDDDNS
jgi:type IV secretion system protein VirB8